MLDPDPNYHISQKSEFEFPWQNRLEGATKPVEYSYLTLSLSRVWWLPFRLLPCAAMKHKNLL